MHRLPNGLVPSFGIFENIKKKRFGQRLIFFLANEREREGITKGSKRDKRGGRGAFTMYASQHQMFNLSWHVGAT